MNQKPPTTTTPSRRWCGKELGHVLLHRHDQVPIAELLKPDSRGRIEVEAESVAFLVSAARGLDTSCYSFPYVGGWMPGKDNLETTLRTTAGKVLGTAHDILDRLDRDQPDLTIPAEDRATVPIDLGPGPQPGMAGPGLDGTRFARQAAAVVAGTSQPDAGGVAR